MTTDTREAPLPGRPVLQLDSVSERYPGSQHFVLRNLRVSLDRGQLIELEGANGSGKSTLLRIAGGLSCASEGTVDRWFTTCACVPSSALEVSRFNTVDAFAIWLMALGTHGQEGDVSDYEGAAMYTSRPAW